MPHEGLLGDPLRDPWLKINRAEEHVNEFLTRFYAWRESGVYEVTFELNQDGTEQIIKLRETKPFPEELTCVIADVIHNLHSALDQLTFILSTRIALCANDEALKQCYFPTAWSREHFESRVAKGKEVGIFSDALIDFFKKFEPYPRGKHEALFRIHELDLADKHRGVVDLHSADIVCVTGPHSRDFVEFPVDGPRELELGRCEPGAEAPYKPSVFPRILVAEIKGIARHHLDELGAYRVTVAEVLRAAEAEFFA
jgi:hypothetical protein